MFKKIIKPSIFALLIIFIFFTFQVRAADLPNLRNAKKITEDTATGIGYRTDVTPEKFVGSIIKTILSLIGILFLVLIIIGGLQWMNAGGNEENIKTARTRIVNATIGLSVVLGAYAITYFVIDIILSKTGL